MRARRRGALADGGVDAASGRFAVEDESGGVLIDDDCFVLRAVTAVVGREIVIREGDRVRVIGTARQASPAEWWSDVGAGFREVGRSLALEGTPDRPLVVTLTARALAKTDP